ncbi:unnamed protein product [Meganyctiphanes norvegica]|uniref:Uncharacterized protein n=1 Tax=Meganyctiphanes norvegica TaxID=48144 RepID=A0AAV2PK53_MEGNR
MNATLTCEVMKDNKGKKKDYIDTNFHGRKCRIAFSVIVPTPGIGFWDHFWLFFKILWSRSPLKKFEIPEPKISHFSGPLIPKGPNKMLNFEFWDLVLLQGF